MVFVHFCAFSRYVHESARTPDYLRRAIADIEDDLGGFSFHKLHQLFHRQRDDAKHQMRHHLGVTLYPHHATTELIFKTTVNPFDGAALVVTKRFQLSCSLPRAFPFAPPPVRPCAPCYGDSRQSGEHVPVIHCAV